MAERGLIGRTTLLHKVERGDARTYMGMSATVRFVLGIHDGIRTRPTAAATGFEAQ